MRIVPIILIVLTLFTSSQSSIEIPKESKQLLLVTTPNWNSKEGTLWRYARDNSSSRWQKVGNGISIILGREGLAWGLGLHSIPEGAKYIKREGDGRSPAGLFRLGNGFGYAPLKIDFPYSVYGRDNQCVDDSNSKWYNKIVDIKEINRDYKSFEYMRLKNDLYKYGIVVKHNSNSIKNGGSCIFIHIRSGNKRGTAGCTAMSEDNILKLLKWLKKDKNPLLLQLPIDEIYRVNF